MCCTFRAVPVWALVTSLLAFSIQADMDPAVLLDDVETTHLEGDHAVKVRNLNLSAGMARLELNDGVLFLASPVAGKVVEMVFIGDARLSLEPPNAIEADQLELFTGDSELDELVSEAVIAVAMDAAAEAIARRPAAENLTPEQSQRAREIFARWKERPERRLLGVDSALFRDALGDPAYEGFFAGWFRGDELGEFLYLYEPDAREQVSLGQFTQLETSERQKRKLSRQFHRAQRQGRLIGLSVEDLGVWDTWLATSRHGEDGQPRPGQQAFEPRHYTLEVTLSESQLELIGKARLELESQTGHSRVVKLELHSDLEVSAVRQAPGDALFFRQLGREILVVLPETPPAGEIITMEVDYAGRIVDKDSKQYALRSTTHWYPHAGEIDRATYDVTLRWPKTLDLVSGGTLVEENKSVATDSGPGGKNLRSERRRVDQPTFGFSFEVGKLRTLTRRAGHVDISLALDAGAASALDKQSQQALLDTVAESLLFFEEVFGPYPLDEMVMVTTPRPASQSFLGFITLSTLNMLDVDWLTVALGIEDRRTVVAHEIAHQWWGHMVGWKSYRDQWISEAMANYSAVLFARHRLRDASRLIIGPTTGWQEAMMQTTAEGRPVESLGPVVLGERLVSSHSDAAYQTVVYQKGAVVLDMLSRGFGEQAFLAMLRDLVETVDFRAISTESFLGLIEQITGKNLSAFAHQFIYGTGLPEVYYSYDFKLAEDGKWQVSGEARQRSPYRYQFRIVVKTHGTLDVARQRLDQLEIDQSQLIVPFQLAVFNPDGPQVPGGRRGQGADARQVGNGYLQGTVALKGASTPLAFSTDYEPKELWLDRRQEVFGRFFNERRHPKRMAYYRGLDAAAAGQVAEAEVLFRKALTAQTFSGPTYGVPKDEDTLEAEGQVLDAVVRLNLAKLYLDQQRAKETQTTLASLRKLSKSSIRSYFGAQIKAIEARLAIQNGDFEQAYKLLRKTKRSPNVETLLLLAIAARETGHLKEYEAAVKAATARGGDVEVLTSR